MGLDSDGRGEALGPTSSRTKRPAPCSLRRTDAQAAGLPPVRVHKEDPRTAVSAATRQGFTSPESGAEGTRSSPSGRQGRRLLAGLSRRRRTTQKSGKWSLDPATER